MIDRASALTLLASQNPERHLVCHALETEAIMAAMARELGEDAELWGLTGLLHDLDYPDTKDDPARHGLDCAALLDGKLPLEAITAIAAHNSEHTGVMPAARLDYALRCAESVTGMISAAALIRPTKMEGLAPKSIKKKMKDKAFAAAVRRENILECDKAGMELDAFLATAIAAMAAIAPEVGLA
ncbi:HDIG domain-containing protein [Desulfovibrio sulfodismutans]|uniref:HDIG domain-containing protein n=1 Tax=Desulfolutivibrio sulfodismutans TaxID=63561 RepID=A0A7K3NR45_9BACT|nr:HDIG domain-containing metalloprotein [Desulfolutivibrio sulfodismutans]NDY58577.1 HDIG domain-containing protein [Desulfolutivibrio sulfodismutans]QLA13917.1 HDIG domain-containing protein [Desulfolutivibrio sulfodismutans DSM 3696]